MTLVNVSKRSATLFQLSLAFIFLLKLFLGQNNVLIPSFYLLEYRLLTPQSNGD